MKTIKCPQCGKNISKDTTHCPHCGESIYKRRLKRKRVIWIVSLLLLALLAFGAYSMFHKNKADMIASNISEEEAWELICQYRDTNNPDSLEGALERYRKTFPKGNHSFDVKTLKERLRKEQRYWESVEDNGAKRELIEKYLYEYKEEGFFYLKAIDKLDSITFFEKQELNTVEAYQDYLDQYPDGRYVEKAKANLSKLDAIPLTDAEEEEAKSVVITHFNAMEAADTAAIAKTMAKNVSSYLGKKAVKQRDVNEFIRHLFETPGRKVNFNLSDFIVRKMVIIEDGAPIYNVSYNLHEEMNKPADNAIIRDTERDFKGTAILNADMLITSLLLEEI